VIDEASTWLATVWARRRLDLRMLASYVKAGHGLDLLMARAPMTFEAASPSTVGIELTNVCQLRCPHCDAQHHAIRGRAGYMTQQTFDRLVDQLGELRVRNLRVIGGGEPTLHPEFAAWLPRLRPLAPYVSVTTNGQRLGHQLSLAMLRWLDVIEVSVASDHAEGYERSRVGGNFVQLLGNLRRLRDLQLETGSRCTIVIRVMLRPSEQAARERLLRFWRAYGDVVATQRLQDYFGAEGDVFAVDPVDGCPPCVLPFRMLGVGWAGDVPLCRGSAFQSKTPDGLLLGNIHTTTLAAMWRGSIIQRYRDGQRTGDPAKMPLCGGCPDAQRPAWRKGYDNNTHLTTAPPQSFVPLTALRVRARRTATS
jgi:pyruvate-formate lyase-activating enzyme